MCSLFPSLDSSVDMSAPHLSSPSLRFPFPLLREGGRRDKGGRWRKTAENANTGPRFFLVTDQASLHHLSLSSVLRTIPALFLCVACRLDIIKPLTSRKPSSAPCPVKRWEQPGDQRGIYGCGACRLLCRWSRTEQGREEGVVGHHFYVCGQTVQHFFALALCQQPTPLSLFPLWELLPPSRSDRERLETKEEKYRRLLGLLSLLKQDIPWKRRGGGEIELNLSIYVRPIQTSVHVIEIKRHIPEVKLKF